MTVQQLRRLLDSVPDDADVFLGRHDYMGGDYQSFYDVPVVAVTDHHVVLAPAHIVPYVSNDYVVHYIYTEADVENAAAPDGEDPLPSDSERFEGLAAPGRDETDESAPVAQDLSTNAGPTTPDPLIDAYKTFHALLRWAREEAHFDSLVRQPSHLVVVGDLFAAVERRTEAHTAIEQLARELYERHDAYRKTAALNPTSDPAESVDYADLELPGGVTSAEALRVFGQPYGP